MMNKATWLVFLLVCLCRAVFGQAVTIRAGHDSVDMGRTVAVTALARYNGKPISGLELWPYVNGRRWGAEGVTDADGRATLLLPLPNVGPARIQLIPQPLGEESSNVITVQVRRRTVTVVRDPNHRIGMDWEPWFTPFNAHWDTAEAIPLLGRYASDNPDVIRQHTLWLDDIGADFVLVDWSNNIWGKQHWREHPPGVDQLIHSTTALLDTLAQMRREGIPTPQVTLLLGLVNGPPAAMSALNEEMRWVAQNYVQNPRYAGLWVTYQDKPLIVVLDTLGPGFLKGQPPVDTSAFTVRWMADQGQAKHYNRAGFWSWMDGATPPLPTFSDGQAEALTVTPAFFGDGGWLGTQARARLGGAIYLEEFGAAFSLRPRFLLINQWNEFAGQPKGQGYGPNHDGYVDTYSVPLSDDIEPTSPSLPGYRGGVGWGFTYLNLTRALVQMYRGQDRDSTLLAVAAPEPGQVAFGASLPVAWAWAGRRPTGVTLLLDGHMIAHGLSGTRYDLPLAGVAPGPHTLAVRAEGAATRFPISATEVDSPSLPRGPVTVTVAFSRD